MASLENFRLVVFRSVAEQLSFRKAAEQLFLTQPAVSLQIKALEEDLGIQLFDRTGKQIALTPAGSLLMRYATQVRELLSEADQKIAALCGDHAGNLALGASTTIAQYVLPSILGDFRRQHPRAAFTLVSGNTEEIVDAVERKSAALGLIEGPAHSRDLKTEPFLFDELVLIVPAAHEWFDRSTIPAPEIAGYPLLLRERGSGTRQVVETALESRGIRRRALNVPLELDSTESIKSAVEAGLGCGFVSRWALAKDSRLGASFGIVNLEGLRIERQFLIATLAGSQLHGLASEFRRFLLARNAAVTLPVTQPSPHKKSK